MEHDVAGSFSTVVAEAREPKLTSDEINCSSMRSPRDVPLTLLSNRLTCHLHGRVNSSQDELGAHLTMLERERIVVVACVP
jgi:hypothetical protein